MINNLPFSYNWLIKKFITTSQIKTILDLGCGEGDFADLFEKGQYQMTGVDIFEPYLKKAETKGKYTKLLKKDLTEKLDFKHKSFDAVVCLQTIEHMKFETGQLLLDRVEKIARKLIIISTPNGKCSQDEYDENKYQHHLSSWMTVDFQKRGYQVFGVGLKGVYGEYSHAQAHFDLMRVPLYILSFLMNPISNINASISAQLVAVKRIS